MNEARIFSLILFCMSCEGRSTRALSQAVACIGDQTPTRRQLNAGLRWLIFEHLIDHASGKYVLTDAGSALLERACLDGHDDAVKLESLEGEISRMLDAGHDQAAD